MKYLNIITFLIVISCQTNIALADTWTVSTSEESPPITLSNGRAVTGMGCSGGYCDNIRLKNHYYVGNRTSNYWTSYFSEEGNNARFCSNNRLVTGIACKGSYCDNVSLQCSGFTGVTTNNTCNWTAWFSEESGGIVSVPGGSYVTGMQCNGSYCDNKRLYYCGTS